MPPLETALIAWAAMLTGRPLPTDMAASAAPATAMLALRVQTIVDRMAGTGRWKEARVLHVECIFPGAPEAERLHQLARHGLTISRSSYYAYLASAKAYVEGALGEGPASESAAA